MSQEKQVTVYSTPTCPWCIRAKDFLAKNKVEFRNVDVSTDHEGAHEMIEKSGQMGVPVITIDEEVIVGYDEATMKELLGIK